MSYKSASTSIISAGTTESSQSRSFNYPDGPGVVITGSQVTSESASYKMIVEEGQGQTFTVIGGGGGANIVIDGIDYLDSSNVVAGNAVSTLGGNILIRGSGFAGSLRVVVGGSSVSNSIINTAAIFSTLSANSAGNVDLFIFESSNVGVISPEQVRYSGAPVWTTTSFEVTEGIAANVELVASSDSTLTYSILSGSGNLPVGLSLVSSGYISGTANGYVSGGSGQVTIVATDQEDQATQQVVTWTVLSAADQNFYRTVLSLNADGVEPFCSDASDNNFQLTVVGDTRPNRMSPYWPGGWSAYFDGTGDYLITPSIGSITADFTIEGWFYPETPTNTWYPYLFGSNSPWTASGGIGISFDTQTAVTDATLLKIVISSTSVTLSTFGSIKNRWNHIAIVRSGTTVTGYLNGVSVVTMTKSGTINTTTFYISGVDEGGSYDNHASKGYISNFRVVKGTALYTSNFTPPSQPLEPIAGTSLLTLRDNAFLDDGPNRFTITRAGDTKITTVSPFITQPYTLTPDSYGGYFDGTGDYLSIAHDSAQNLGAVDFTVECWFCQTAAYNNYSTGAILAKSDTGATKEYIFNVTSTAMGIEFYGTSTIQTSVTYTPGFTMGVWYHIAYVRQGGTLYYYVNGTQIGSTNLGAGYTFTAITIEQRIGRTNNSTYNFNFNGYISNLRVVKGTAVYTSNFTPPTAPLSAISGTSLLTCQSTTFVDNSTNAFAITANGNTVPTPYNPFGETITTISNYSYDSSVYSASGYFDGSGDYLTTPSNTAFAFGTGNWTIEGWVYLTQYIVGNQSSFASPSTGNENLDIGGTANSPGKISYWNGSSGISSAAGVVPLNSWAHLAWVREGGTVFGYVNGVRVLSGSIAAPNNTSAISFNSGSGLYGYISNLRIVKGTALYTGPFVPPTAPLAAVANTSLLTLQRDLDADNSGFVDVSSNNLLVTRAGNTTQGSASPFAPSGWSAYFDGSGDYLLIPGTVSAYNCTGDFTLECWAYITSASAYGGLISLSSATGANGGRIAILNTGYINFAITGQAYDGTLVPLNQWFHVAMVRLGSSTNNVSCYLNGQLVGQFSSTAEINRASNNLVIGRYYADGTNQYWTTGYISNARYINGTAVYTSNFTPPTAPLTAIAGTSLLACQSPSLTDAGPYRFTITRNGDTKIVPLSPFVPQTVTPDSYSGYFDGTGDYLTVPSNEVFAFGTGDFTIEFWIYLLESKNGYHFVNTNNSSSSGSVIVGTNGSAYLEYYNGASRITDNTAMTLNSWVHVALSRSSGISKLFKNGTQVGSNYTDSINCVNTSTLLIAARNDNLSFSVNGQISSLRIVKGTAVYTSNFTPPTAPLTAIAGTSLLTCQSTTFVDNSTNALAITVAGNAQPTTLNPFGSTVAQDVTAYSDSSGAGSAYFDGSADYLQFDGNNILPTGTENFTVEFWFYQTKAFASSQGASYITTAGTSNGFQLWINVTGGGIIRLGAYAVAAVIDYSYSTISLNVWNHFAITRSGNTFTMYLNGVQVATATSAVSFAAPGTSYIGSGSYGGYISNMRVVRGSVVYTSNFTPPAAPLSAIAGTSLLLPMTNGGIYDATERNVLETVGNTRINTAIKKYGSGSIYFDGTGDYLTVNSPSWDSFAFGTGDFTIEFWMNTPTASTSYALYDARPTNTNGAYVHIYTENSNIGLYVNTATRIVGGTLINNTWQHVALSRSGTSTRLFLNGTQVGSTYTDTTNYLGGRPLIGANGYNTAVANYSGYIDDLRITNGYARYVANFTPPDIPNPAY